MKSRMRWLHWTALCAGLLLSSVVGTGEHAPAGGQASLDIRIHPTGTDPRPPAELLLSNPDGDRTGKDPETGKVYREIPQASYESESIADDVSGAPGPESSILFIRHPIPGQYILTASGFRSGSYILEIQVSDGGLAVFRERLGGYAIEPGVQQQFLLEYSGETGGRIRVIPLEKDRVR